jgi:hypothetical protein
MPNTNGTGGWKPGQSGNPNGRPPKERTYADLINKALSHKASNGVQRKKILAELISQAATEGQVKFPGDADYSKLSMSEWRQFTKDLLSHLEPPPMQVDTTGHQTVEIIVKHSDRAEPTHIAPETEGDISIPGETEDIS